MYSLFEGHISRNYNLYAHIHAYLYVYLHVCMYICTYICMYVCIYLSMHAHIHICMYICRYLCMCPYRHICFYDVRQAGHCMYVCMYNTRKPVRFEFSSNVHMYCAFGNHIFSFSNMTASVYLVWQTLFFFFMPITFEYINTYLHAYIHDTLLCMSI